MKTQNLLRPAAVAIIALCSAVFALSSSAEEPVLLPAVEATPRGGLPNVFAKLQAGGEVKIGYLGGSITAAPGWRVKSLAWFQEQYPNAKVSEINAAIGGTGSDLGVFRANQDVIGKHPDLLFIEFAVNDSGGNPVRIHQCMEGIVRQTWKANPLTDICFVYTLSEPMLSDLSAGKFPRAAGSMEAIADYYGIPSIHFGLDIAKRVNNGTLIFKAAKDQVKANQTMVFSTDGVHPLIDTGHELYTQTLIRNLPAISLAGKPGPHTTGKPFREDHWENAKIVPVTQSMLKGNWTKLDPNQPGKAKDFQARLPVLWKTNEPGASLEFTLDGKLAEIYDIIGPDGCLLEVAVDGKPIRKFPRFDTHCSYSRLSKASLYSAAEPGRHQIKVSLTDEKLDKQKLLGGEHVEKFTANPGSFQESNWYVGSLLILGDVVE